VVLVDTPPLAARDGGAGDRWMNLLRRAEPREVHLALPAGLRAEVATVLREDLLRAQPTHLLLTKLDEVPGGAGAVEIPLRMEMPARWVSDAPEGHAPLHAAVPRILDLLGVELAAPAAVPG
jgi:flagellar biosynthesis GTPase FlhF